MVQDPDNPSIEVNADGSYSISLDKTSAPVATALYEAAQAELANAKTLGEWQAAVGTALNGAFMALQFFEYQARERDRANEEQNDES